MKKVLHIIVIAFLVLVLSACEELFTEKYTIRFEENGGTEVSDMSLKLDELETFTLPSAPTKEGYQFGGWYVDSELQNSFESLPLEIDEIILYAKWNRVKSNGDVVEEVQGVKTTASFNLKYEEVELENSYTTEVSVDLEVVTSQEEVTTLEELSFGLKLDLGINGYQVVDGEYVPLLLDSTLEMICHENMLYLTLPGELTGQTFPLSISINLQTLLDELQNQPAVPDYPATDPDSMDMSNFVSGLLEEIMKSENEDIVSVIIAYFKESGEFEFTDEEWVNIEVFLNSLFEVLGQIKPTETVEGTKTTYSITDQNIQDWSNDIYDFIDENYEFIISFASSEEEPATKEENMEVVSQYVTMINNSINLKKCELALTNDNGELSKVEFDLIFQGDDAVKAEKLFGFEIDAEVNFNYQKVELLHPNNTNYTDMTAMIIQSMGGTTIQ